MGIELVSEEFGYAYQDYEGTPYPPMFNLDAISELRKHFIPSNDDIVIATYPKCGTTWTQHIVALLLSYGKDSTVLLNNWIEVGASKDYIDSKALMQQKEQEPQCRRAFKTHAPYHLLPCKELSSGTKIIYVTRNPKDCAVSMYHHAKNIPFFKYTGDFHHFLGSLFCKGKVSHGSWFDHTIGWVQAAKNHPTQILIIAYEDMKRKPKDMIQRIANFIEVELSDDVIDAIVKQTSFEEMKTQHDKETGSYLPKTHFRKGDIGDWKNYFTSEESKQFDQLYQEKMVPIANEFDVSFE